MMNCSAWARLLAVSILGGLMACDAQRPTDVELQPTLSIALSVTGTEVLGDAFDEVDNVVVEVGLPSGDVIREVIQVTPEDSVIRARIALPLEGDEEPVTVTVALRRGSEIVFTGSESIVVGPGVNEVDLVLESVPGLEPGTGSISAGAGHTCGIDASGAAHCWGSHESGQLGIGASSPDQCGDVSGSPCALSPAAVAGGLTFSLITAGEDHTCGLTPEGQAYCWGTDGALGISSAPEDCGDFEAEPCARSPQAVEGGHAFVSLSAGADHVCGLTEGGAAFCWGQNGGAELGDGTTIDRATPVAVAGGHTFMAIDAGEGQTCALRTDGAALCWGSDSSLGVTTPPDDCEGDPCAKTPVAVAGGHTFTQISVNGPHTCGISTDGQTRCWGEGGGGKLGDGSTTDRPTPVVVTGGHAFIAITTAEGFSCALTAEGTAYCWGEGDDGKLGTTAPDDCSDDGEAEPCALSPVPVSGGHVFVEISAGVEGAHTCAITTAGAGFCWGGGEDGQLGNGSATDRSTPVAVSGGIRFRTP